MAVTTVWATFVLACITLTHARPKQTNLEVPEVQAQEKRILGKTGDLEVAGSGLLESSEWKELMEEGNVRRMVNTVQRYLGAKRPVKLRTEWKAEKVGDLTPSLSVHHTMNLNAFHSKKSDLNLIADSKFFKENKEVDMIDPSVGLHYQLKY